MDTTKLLASRELTVDGGEAGKLSIGASAQPLAGTFTVRSQPVLRVFREEPDGSSVPAGGGEAQMALLVALTLAHRDEPRLKAALTALGFSAFYVDDPSAAPVTSPTPTTPAATGSTLDSMSRDLAVEWANAAIDPQDASASVGPVAEAIRRAYSHGLFVGARAERTACVQLAYDHEQVLQGEPEHESWHNGGEVACNVIVNRIRERDKTAPGGPAVPFAELPLEATQHALDEIAETLTPTTRRPDRAATSRKGSPPMAADATTQRAQRCLYAVVCADGRLRSRRNGSAPVSMARDGARRLRALGFRRSCSGGDRCSCCPCGDNLTAHKIVRIEVPHGR